MPVKRSKLRVAIMIETSRGFGRGVIRGVIRYAKLHGPWMCYLLPGDRPRPVPPPRVWDGDGVIGRVSDPEIFSQIRRRGLKAVSIEGNPADGGVHVGTSAIAGVRCAAEHLIEKGIHRLAFLHVAELDGRSTWNRAGAFRAVAEEKKMPCQILDVVEYSSAEEHHDLQSQLIDWLAGLEKPVGLIANDDVCAIRAVNACLAAGIRVPEQVAVVGIDNDALLCESTYPTISSVSLNAEKLGFEAARLLDQQFRGGRPLGWNEIRPEGVVTRQSSDLVAIDDPDVAAAVRFIRENIAHGIDVGDVVNAVPVARRSLEHRMKAVLGRTPKAEIRRVQMQLARDLLLTTTAKLPEIARASGFTRVNQMHVAFIKQLGMTPAKFRNSARR
jgi:LacI family transcriptional regulator